MNDCEWWLLESVYTPFVQSAELGSLVSDRHIKPQRAFTLS